MEARTHRYSVGSEPGDQGGAWKRRMRDGPAWTVLRQKGGAKARDARGVRRGWAIRRGVKAHMRGGARG